ncbi:hypothetical protein D3C80_1333120 [compost metagenome]
MKKYSLLLTFLLAITSVCMAHPGHGDHTHDDGGYTITHYFTQPFHVITGVLLAGVICLVLLRVYKRNKEKAQ